MPLPDATKLGKMVVISGPSGAGKSTIVRRLLQVCPLPLIVSVSATTRKPRSGEVEGIDYHFLSPEEFARRREAGEFLECMDYAGNWYGTLQSQVTSGLAAGKWVLLEIDVAGTIAVIEKHPEALTIFLHSGSIEELERRLVERKTETRETIERRLAVARRELEQAHRYRYQVINRDVEQAVRDICDILVHHAEN
ncbi:MAG TPA: guanylate kinase [Pirellulaceae bacterium]|nr:guanylate kinase [Pirellulaceae bacterium]